MGDYIREELKERRMNFTRKIDEWRDKLEKNEIYIKFFSMILLGIFGCILSCLGYKLNKKNVQINERQLEIVEKAKSPVFALDQEYAPRMVNNINKVEKFCYTITNEGEIVSNINVYPKAYVYFYIPTGMGNECYILRCMSHDFDQDGILGFNIEEKDWEFSFYEYVYLKDDYTELSEWQVLGESILKHLPKGAKYKCKKVIEIEYDNYMGERTKKVFDFKGPYLNEVREEDFSFETKEFEPKDLQDLIDTTEDEISDWLESNRDAKKYKMP